MEQKKKGDGREGNVEVEAQDRNGMVEEGLRNMEIDAIDRKVCVEYYTCTEPIAMHHMKFHTDLLSQCHNSKKNVTEQNRNQCKQNSVRLWSCTIN